MGQTRYEPEQSLVVAGLRRQFRRHPRLSAVVGSVLAVVGLVAAIVASEERILTTAIVVLAVGLLAGMAALLILHELFLVRHDDWARERPAPLVAGPRPEADGRPLPRDLRLVLGLTLALWPAVLAVGVVAVLVALQLQSVELTVLTMAVVLVGVVAAMVALSDDVERRGRLVLVVGTALSVVGAAAVALGPDGLWPAGALLGLVGITGVKVALLPVVDRVGFRSGGRGLVSAARIRARRALALFVLGIVLLAAGAGLGWVGTDAESPQLPLVVLGMLVGLGGLTLAGATAPRILPARRAVLRWVIALGIIAVGVALLGVGGIQAGRIIDDWRAVAGLLVVLLLAFGAWAVLRGETLVALLLLTFLLAWALHDRSSQNPAAFNADRAPYDGGGMLALGDSFMSGEGAGDFFTGTNEPGSNECRRALTSYAALVSASLDLELHHFACSGATIDQMLTDAQMPNSPPGVVGNDGQLDTLGDPTLITPQGRDELEIVLVSVGGNDTGFSTVIQACLLPESDCSDQQAEWVALAESLEGRLADAYRRVDEETGDAAILVVPYPNWIEPTDCGRLATRDEFGFTARFIDVINRTIYRAARTANADGARVWVVDNDDTLIERNQCLRGQPGPAANLVTLAPTSAPFPEVLDPGTWVHGSMHPFEDGHALQADAIEAPVGVLLDCGADDCRPPVCDVDPLAPGPPGDGSEPSSADARLGVMLANGTLVDTCATYSPATAPDDRDELAAAGRALLDDNSWLTTQVWLTARALVVPVLALVLAGLLGAAGLVRLAVERQPPVLRWVFDLVRFLAPTGTAAALGTVDADIQTSTKR